MNLLFRGFFSDFNFYRWSGENPRGKSNDIAPQPPIRSPPVCEEGKDRRKPSPFPVMGCGTLPKCPAGERFRKKRARPPLSPWERSLSRSTRCGDPGRLPPTASHPTAAA